MGWTSKQYIGDSNHTSIEAPEASALIKKEYNGMHISHWHLHRAKDQYDHNELYCVMRDVRKFQSFICVFLIDIKDDEIYWKSIEERMGPAYTNCPPEFFLKALCPNKTAHAWREQCKKK